MINNMNLDQIKKEIMRKGMKLLANPKVMKMMADPRFLKAISQGFALKGKLENEVEQKLYTMANILSLATKKDLRMIERTLNKVEDTLGSLERRIDQIAQH